MPSYEVQAHESNYDQGLNTSPIGIETPRTISAISEWQLGDTLRGAQEVTNCSCDLDSNMNVQFRPGIILSWPLNINVHYSETLPQSVGRHVEYHAF